MSKNVGGRPPKYDWVSIRAEYESGISRKDIIRRYKCPDSGISERIKRENWQVSEDTVGAVRDLVSVSEKVSEIVSESREKADAVQRALNIEQRRQGIVKNNLGLFGALQKLVATWIADDEVDPVNFRQITGGLKDINDAAHPKTPQNVIQNNNVQENTENKQINIYLPDNKRSME